MLSSCQLGDLNAVKEILKSGNDHEKDIDGSNGFMIACHGGHLNIVKYLVEMNYNINLKDNFGNNGLMWACRGGHLNIVNYLVEMNYNINEKDDGGKNSLMIAFSDRKYDIVIYLLEHGCEINEKYIKKIKSDEILCKKIEKRMEKVQTFYDEIEKNLNEIDIRIVHEIKAFTYGLQNLKMSY